MRTRIVVEHGTPAYWVLALHATACRSGLVDTAASILRLPTQRGADSTSLSRAMRLVVWADSLLRERAVRRGARNEERVTDGVANPHSVAIDNEIEGEPRSASLSSTEVGSAELILYLGVSEPPSWLVASARFGVLRASDGIRGLGGGERPSHLQSLVDGAPTVSIELWHHQHGTEAKRVFLSRIQTRGVSPAIHDELCALRTADLLILVAERLLATDFRWRQPVVPGTSDTRVASSSASPANRKFGSVSAMRVLSRRAGATLRAHRESSFWSLAYRRTLNEPLHRAVEQLHEVERLLPPARASWADPFPVRAEGRDLVFFEEELADEPHAHISVAELLPDGRLTPPQRVLSGPGHLSYPCLFRFEGEWFMVPESATSWAVSLYRATDFPLRWVKECDLVTSRQIVDPTVFQHEGRWWLLGGRVGLDKAPFEDLEGYSAPALTGPWTEHALNPLVSDAYGGRPAGHLFRDNGQLVRPAQDCSVIYGHGLSFQHVTALSDEDYSERLIARRSADWNDELTGVHTFNRSETLTWVDLRWRRSRK